MIESTNQSNVKQSEINNNIIKVNKKTLWLPMKLVQVYLAIVFILFAFGPWPWPIDNRFEVYLYIISAQVLLLFGFYFSIRKRKMAIKINIEKKHNQENQKIIRYLLILSFLFFIPIYLSRAGLNTFSFKQFYNSFINGLFNPGAQYYQRLQLADQATTNNLLIFLIAITAPYRWLFIPLGIVNWSKLRPKYKIGLITFILFDTISWITIGTNKGVFDNVFIISFSMLVKVLSQNSKTQKVIKKKKGKVPIIIFSLIILAFAILYMTNAIISRVGTLSYYHNAANVYVDFNSPILSIAPKFLRDPLIIIASYTTQGYYGLSLAMNESFTTTYGFGNSWVLLSIAKKITGNDMLYTNTYPFKIQKYGWDPYVNWHSIYTWLASDYSFIGTLLIMIIIGYWFGEVWKSVLEQRNIYAIGLFVLFMIMFMYFPANNQVFANINSFTAFWGLFILWIFSAKVRFRVKVK